MDRPHTFMRITSPAFYFIGPPPKVGEAIEMVCVAIEPNGVFEFQLRTRQAVAEEAA